MAQLHPAEFFSPATGEAVRCELCPCRCLIAPGGCGRCLVRTNRDGVLYSASYGRIAACHVDPIEKKPLAEFLPGSRTFSIGTLGCNLACRFCQNDTLSRNGLEYCDQLPEVAADEVVAMALQSGCKSVAFTYNEPTVFFEYACETARLARQAGLATVLVSNGWIQPEPRAVLYPLIDAANIDVKGFSDEFYSKLCGGALRPVLESCVHFKKECGGHLELTNLVIPGQNDSDPMLEAFCDWVAEHLGEDTPVHFSAYFPAGGFSAPSTPPGTLYHARELALRRGLQKIYLGNLR